MNIIFMGTPDFAVASLDAIYENGYNISLVITQEDKPKNRGKKIQITPVKKRALELGLEVYQPAKIKTDEAYDVIKKINPDLIIVTAYGQILPKRILDIPKFGCINVHASLLPRLRGAAPIQFSIINGEKITGITTMYMSEGLDTGDIIYKEEVDILDSDNSVSLYEKLAILSKKILPKTIKAIASNSAPREKQNDSLATYTKLITKEMGKLDFSLDAKYINNLIRGLDPWPSSYAILDGEIVKLFNSRVGNDTDSKDFGRIVTADKDCLEIIANNSTIKVYEIQFPNKKRLLVKDFLNGNKNIKNKKFE